ncbi:MAG TPA: DoxX family protein [Thermoanaerobaculia bacterium]|nr:DoxX family protein [Thermoanaerobaculia bacterium]
MNPSPMPSAPRGGADDATLFLRLALGVVFVYHALLKLVVFTLPGTVAFFESAGLPGFAAYPVFALELAAGLLLVAGFQTRWAALAIVPVMLGAITVHWGNGFSFDRPGGGWEYPAFLAVIGLALFLVGDDGPLSAGRALLRSRRPAAPRALGPQPR